MTFKRLTLSGRVNPLYSADTACLRVMASRHPGSPNSEGGAVKVQER
jgi:hypothetical protein